LTVTLTIPSVLASAARTSTPIQTYDVARKKEEISLMNLKLKDFYLEQEILMLFVE